MYIKQIKKVSRKQAKKNQEINRIKKDLDYVCARCGKYGVGDAAHIIPKSMFPQYYTEKWNIVIMCRMCHNEYDESKEVRESQARLFTRALNNVNKEDKGRVMKYFNKL